MAGLTDAQGAFIRDNAFYCVLTTLREDGSPHSTVVWVDEVDGKLLLNTVIGRVKERHLRRDPRASVVVLDAASGYRWVSVSGTVRLTTENANADIERLSQKYDGQPFRELAEGEVRITAYLTPVQVTGYGV